MNKKVKYLIIAAAVAFGASIAIEGCAIDPESWSPPLKPKLSGSLAENELLSTTTWIELGDWYGPEDVAVDKDGNLYCGARPAIDDFSDGRILKINSAGVVSVFCDTASWVAGLHFDSNENLIACDQERGLISVDKQGQITVLASQDQQGNLFLGVNDVDIASDGIIYFSNSTSRIAVNHKGGLQIVLEAKADGGLYSYDPATKAVTTLISDAFFGNGVAVSNNDAFVLLVELTKYRVLRHWLQGPKAGQTEMFIENLPGIPNGIARRADGSFWLGFTSRRNDLLDQVHPSTLIKQLIYGLPDWMRPAQEAFGMIMQLSADGAVLKTYYDTTGEFVSEASSIEESDGYLYIGGDLTNHIGKFRLQ